MALSTDRDLLRVVLRVPMCDLFALIVEGGTRVEGGIVPPRLGVV